MIICESEEQNAYLFVAYCHMFNHVVFYNLALRKSLMFRWFSYFSISICLSDYWSIYLSIYIHQTWRGLFRVSCFPSGDYSWNWNGYRSSSLFKFNIYKFSFSVFFLLLDIVSHNIAFIPFFLSIPPSSLPFCLILLFSNLIIPMVACFFQFSISSFLWLHVSPPHIHTRTKS